MFFYQLVLRIVYSYTQFHFSVVVDNFGDKYEKYGGEATRIVATYYQLMRFCSAPKK